MEISVIIPVYNAEKYIRKAVESALQFIEVKEILLIEDGSPDKSLPVCFALENEFSKVRLIQHADQKNHGAGATRNLGLENALCDFIAFLDADDYFLSNRFDSEKKYLRSKLMRMECTMQLVLIIIQKKQRSFINPPSRLSIFDVIQRIFLMVYPG